MLLVTMSRPELPLACRSAALFTFGFLAACLVGVIVAGALHYTVLSGVNVGIGAAVGVCIFLVTAACAFLARKAKGQSFREWVQLVGFAGTREVRRTFKYKPKRWQSVMHMLTFDVMIKYACPPVFVGAMPLVLYPTVEQSSLHM